MRIALYTAIFGNYDTLKNQPYFPDTDYICFTDGYAPNSGPWGLIRVQPPTGEHSRITAKRFKTCPHLFLKNEYDYSIWIDGSIAVVNPLFIQQALSGLREWGIACMKHPVGDCIFQEAYGCAHMAKYQSQPVVAQAESYRAQGYPEKNGLAACGIIVRDMRHPKLPEIGEAWLHENMHWTYQDQISFPYVLWKHSHWFDLIPFQYVDRTMFVLCDHRHEG